MLQIRDLNAGTFGFVELALDKSTGQQVAIKFIERGDKVGSRKSLQRLIHQNQARSGMAEATYLAFGFPLMKLLAKANKPQQCAETNLGCRSLSMWSERS